MVQPGESTYDGFHRYGFRVPAVLVGPYVKRDYVSHVVYDHTSILAFLARKWNLPALTYRDANANDLTDFLDVNALAAGQPTFPELPALAAPGDTPATRACLSIGPGKIPPASAAPLPAPPIRMEIKRVRVNRRLRGVVVELKTNRGSLSEVVVELQHGKHRVASARLARVSTRPVRAVLRVHHKIPAAGRYEVVARHRGDELASRAIRVR